MQPTIQPTSVTNFQRTDAELQSFWLFCMFVAGKNSDHAARCLERLLHKAKGFDTPFEYLSSIGEVGIHNALVASKIGQYARLTKGILHSLRYATDLRTVSVDELQTIFGVGPKTARFFVLHSRADAKCAVLDTHILKWMREHGMDAPFQTPQNMEVYKYLESQFIGVASMRFPNLTLAEIDLIIWTEQSGRLA